MKQVFLLMIAFCVSQLLYAQDNDAENCKDHAFFNRLPNFRIESCESNFNLQEFFTGANKKESVEGNVTKLRYVWNSETAKPPSPLQLTRNYEAAITKNGGKKIYIGNEDGDPSYIGLGTFTMSKDGKEYWVTVTHFSHPVSGGEVPEFSLIILEKEAMKQDIEANAMFKEIEAKGSISLYINFETGKSAIKPESQNIVDQMTEMLKANPALKVSIEGHTDNVGTPAANQKLSEERAAALVKALVAKGIDKSRLASKGWGQTKPAADNNIADGKAKNRRVEIVKM